VAHARPFKKAKMNKRRPHIRELDGIRALAIGLVLVTHLFDNVAIVPQSFLSALPLPLRVIVAHGWLGVDLFFVLSGFLITGILLKAKGEPGYFRDFYIRRVLRILPLYYLVVLVLTTVYGYREYATFWNFALGLSANLSGLVDASVPPGAGPMWSLGVEEQFYLFWPLVVLILSRQRLAFVAIIIIVIEPIVRYWAGAGSISYPWCRFDGLALGSLLALWFSAPSFTPQKTLRLGAGLAAVSAGILLATAPFGGYKEGALSAATRISEGTLMFGAFIAAAIALRNAPATGILRSRAARVVADLSFCLYLVHVPLLELFEFLSHSVVPSVGRWDPAVLVPVRAIVVITAAFGVAALSRRYLELPFLRLKPALSSAETRNLVGEAR
jgi:peptidoglycan/LPS O-acetylase OafA/YrhL